MATTRPFAIYQGGDIPTGTIQSGNFLIGVDNLDYASRPGGLTWYMGPDEDSGIVIASANEGAPTFWRSSSKSAQDFMALINNIYSQIGSESPFNNVGSAKAWMNDNGVFFTENIVNLQSMAFATRYSNTNNWGYIIMDYDSNEINDYDLGLLYDDWYISDLYPINNKGYIMIMRSTSDWQVYHYFYMNSIGEIVYDFSGISSSLYYDILDGFWAVVYDASIPRLTYFNGTDSFEYTPPEDSWVDWNWEWDATGEAKTWVLRIEIPGISVTYYLINDTGELTEIISYDPNESDVQLFQYTSGYHIVALYRNIDGYYYQGIYFDARNQSILTSFTLDPNDQYNSYELDFYGYGKSYLIFWASDWEKEYKIKAYDENINTLIQSTHARSTVYNSIRTYSGNPYYPWEDSVGSSHYTIYYQDTGNYDSNYWLLIPYLDIEVIVDEANDVYLHYYQDSGTEDKSISINRIVVTDSLYLFGDRGLGNLTLSIVNGQSSIIEHNLGPASNINDTWSNTKGNNLTMVAWTSSSYTEGIYYLFKEDGTMRDSKTFSTEGSYGISIDEDLNLYYFTDGTTHWVANTQQEAMVDIGIYTHVYDSYNYALYDHATRIPSFAFYSSDTNIIRIATNTNIYSNISLTPPLSSWDIHVGPTMFLYTRDTISGNTYELYDFNGNIICSLDTGGNINNAKLLYDRAYVLENLESSYRYHMLCEGGPFYKDGGEFNNYAPNDIILWD